MLDLGIMTLAVAIADDAAAIDLTAYCVAVEDAGTTWRRLPAPGRYGEDAAVAQRAADYLERRMRLQRHPGDASLVRLLPRPVNQVDGLSDRSSAISAPLCWVPEDELPQSLPSTVYDALFSFSRVDVIRMFPIFGPTQAVANMKPVAYLDLGAGGYMDVGTDLSDDQLSRLPKGRHMLGIIEVCGTDGHVASQPVDGQSQLMLYQHDDGRYGISRGTAGFAQGDPAWHRVPIDVIEETLRTSTQDGEDADKYRRLHTPEIKDFLGAVENEALFQREKWGAQGDAGKSDADWFWLVGYLAGKAIRPDATDEKRLHHIVTTAAACLNWHAARVGTYMEMRPGMANPDAIPATEEQQ